MRKININISDNSYRLCDVKEEYNFIESIAGQFATSEIQLKDFFLPLLVKRQNFSAPLICQGPVLALVRVL